MPASRMLLLRLAALTVLASGCASGMQAPPTRTLTERIDSILDSPPLQRTSWGVLVRDQADGRVLYQRNADRHFIPASNTKLVVTTVAMGMLGPDWRYHTPVFARLLPGDTVADELRIIGSGDPTFSARFWQRPHAAAGAMATTIGAAGIRHVRRLVVDASRFTDAAVNGTWEVGDLPGTSAPPVGAFQMEEGVFQLELRGAAQPGQGGFVAPLVPLAAPALGAPQPIHAELLTDTAGARTFTSTDFTARRDTIYLVGRIAAGRTDTVRLAMTDAPAYAAKALAQALAGTGVVVDTVLVLRQGAAADTVGMHRIGQFESPPLREIVAAILQPSQNWIAETLLKTLGAERGTSGSWNGGLAVERRYLIDSVHIDSLAFSLRDGSGLSAQNLLTPAATVQLLEHARTSPWGDLYLAGLAGPGIAGSTVENRLPAFKGRLQAKTGTISNVNSLSGFLTTDAGRNVTFSIMSNGSGVASGLVRAAIDSTVSVLARERR